MRRLGVVLAMVLATTATAEARCTASLASVCERHAPAISLAERVQLVAPGETVTNAVTIRNADSCVCARACFQVTSGYHPPHDGSASLRVDRTSVRTRDGRAANPLCLEPGEEFHGTLTLAISPEQDGAGYVTPVVFAYRPSEPCYVVTPDGYAWGPGCFEQEGAATCAGMDYFTCRAFVYAEGPAQ